MIIFKILLGAFTGLVAHVFTYKPTTRLHGKWGDITRYWIGGVLLLSILPIFLDIKKENTIDEYIVSGILTTASVGTGVVIGHVFDKR